MSAMGNTILVLLGHFRECFAGFIQEMRIIPKPACSAGIFYHSTRTRAAHDMLVSAGQNQCHGTDEFGVPWFGNILQV